MSTTAEAFIATDALLSHWQGHRRLTRRLIEAFPEEQLFTFSLAGVRTFGEMALELLSMAEPTARGLVNGEWATSWDRDPIVKEELLRRWDASTAAIDEVWPQVPAGRFTETMTAFGEYTGIGHHRGQGYVYLRALGVEPPAFWDR